MPTGQKNQTLSITYNTTRALFGQDSEGNILIPVHMQINICSILLLIAFPCQSKKSLQDINKNCKFDFSFLNEIISKLLLSPVWLQLQNLSPCKCSKCRAWFCNKINITRFRKTARDSKIPLYSRVISAEITYMAEFDLTTEKLI